MENYDYSWYLGYIPLSNNMRWHTAPGTYILIARGKY